MRCVLFFFRSLALKQNTPLPLNEGPANHHRGNQGDIGLAFLPCKYFSHVLFCGPFAMLLHANQCKQSFSFRLQVSQLAACDNSNTEFLVLPFFPNS